MTSIFTDILDDKVFKVVVTLRRAKKIAVLHHYE